MSSLALRKILESIIKDAGGVVDKNKMKQYIASVNNSFTSSTRDYWLGIEVLKNPSELMVLQEIIFEKRPDTIIECGTACGGSAYFMACLMDLLDINGQIITIDHHLYEPSASQTKDLDYDLHQLPFHPKIKFVHSDCLKAAIPEPKGKTMVILDCDHTKEHVAKELLKFSPLVSIGQYLVVEDTGLYEDEVKGPAAAIEEFLSKNKHFKIDRNREKYGTSTSLGGYLLRC